MMMMLMMSDDDKVKGKSGPAFDIRVEAAAEPYIFSLVKALNCLLCAGVPLTNDSRHSLTL